MSRETRVETLKAVAEQKKQNALDKTEKAIAQLAKEGKRLNFPNIAREAGVSVSYLYKYPEIKDRIQTLRKQQENVGKPPLPQPASDKSKMVIINQLRERIKKLETQRDELRLLNEKITGRLYQLQGTEELVERLRAENAFLKKQLEECLRSQKAALPTDSPKVTPIAQGKSRTKSEQIIKSKLDRLGIKLNSTLQRKIRAADEQTVLNAIAALEEAMGTGKVKNAAGFLVQAISEGWEKTDPPQQQRQPEIFTASPEPDEDLVPLDQLKKLLGGTDD